MVYSTSPSSTSPGRLFLFFCFWKAIRLLPELLLLTIDAAYSVYLYPRLLEAPLALSLAASISRVRPRYSGYSCPNVANVRFMFELSLKRY